MLPMRWALPLRMRIRWDGVTKERVRLFDNVCGLCAMRQFFGFQLKELALRVPR